MAKYVSMRRVPQNSKIWCGFVLGALALALGAAGCMQSSTQPEPAANTPSFSDVPTLAEVQAVAGLSNSQTAALATAHREWQLQERSWMGMENAADEPPVLGFLGACAPILDRTQMDRLVGALQRFEAGQMPALGMDAGLFGDLDMPGMMGGGGGRHGGPHPGPGMNPWAGLGLTAEQLVQLRHARQTLMDTVHSLVEQYRNGGVTQEQFTAGVAQARADFETALQGILRAEQYAQLQQLRRDRLIAVLAGGLARFDTETTRLTAALTRILSLSDAQAASIQTLLTDSKPQVEAVLARLRDSSLSPQDAVAALNQIQRDTAASIRATLSPEQAAIFDQLMALRRWFPGCRP